MATVLIQKSLCSLFSYARTLLVFVVMGRDGTGLYGFAMAHPFKSYCIYPEIARTRTARNLEKSASSTLSALLLVVLFS